MMNTLSPFPRNTAHPPLVGSTARTCTSITVLFIRGNGISASAKDKMADSCALVLACARACLKVRSSLVATLEKTRPEWDVDAAIATYNIDGWGAGYFTVNAQGNVEARPAQENGGSIDILDVVNEARARGLAFPLVIRLQDLLKHRVESVNRAFESAIGEFGYRNSYRGVFPIKVNQLREVIEEIAEAGLPFHFGLEAGSKPELVAALALHTDPESLIVCNGYKDSAFIRI